MESADQTTDADNRMLPVIWPDHSVVWLSQDEQPYYRAGLLTGLRIILTMAILVTALMLWL
ncbi:hypothetical protein ACU4GI_19815 [Cupriavidus basilensis]